MACRRNATGNRRRNPCMDFWFFRDLHGYQDPGGGARAPGAGVADKRRDGSRSAGSLERAKAGRAILFGTAVAFQARAGQRPIKAPGASPGTPGTKAKPPSMPHHEPRLPASNTYGTAADEPLPRGVPRLAPGACMGATSVPNRIAGRAVANVRRRGMGTPDPRKTLMARTFHRSREAVDVDHGQLVYPSLKERQVESGPARALASRSAGHGPARRAEARAVRRISCSSRRWHLRAPDVRRPERYCGSDSRRNSAGVTIRTA
jgi:hypothetical protein